MDWPRMPSARRAAPGWPKYIFSIHLPLRRDEKTWFINLLCRPGAAWFFYRDMQPADSGRAETPDRPAR
jgi:hypothetical protein